MSRRIATTSKRSDMNDDKGHSLVGTIQFVLPPAISGLFLFQLITILSSMNSTSRQQFRIIGWCLCSVILILSIIVCKHTAPKQHTNTKGVGTTTAAAAAATSITTKKKKKDDDFDIAVMKKEQQQQDGKRTDLANIRQEQLSIQYQIWCASQFCIATFSTIYYGYEFLDGTSYDDHKNSSSSLRLLLSVRSFVGCGPAFVLGLSIVNVGLKRYPSPSKSIRVTDGQSKDEEMIFPLSFLQNTIEQLLLHCFASLGLATTLPSQALHLVPALSIFWVCGRITFYMTYKYFPVMRAFGFSMSIGPSMASIVYCTISTMKEFFVG